MKIVLLTLFVLLMASASAAQEQTTTCNMSLDSAPQMWGFQLGMTVEQAKQRYPSMVIEPADSFGMARGYVYPSEDAKTQKNYKWLIVDVIVVHVGFINGKLDFVGAAYREGLAFPNIEAYLSNLSATYGLPNAWQTFKNSESTKEIQCGGFNMFAFTSPGVAFGLFDTVATDEYDKRLKAYQKESFDRYSRGRLGLK